MTNDDSIIAAIHKLKGIYVILSSLSNDISCGASYVDESSALRLIAEQLYGTASDLETAVTVKK